MSYQEFRKKWAMAPRGLRHKLWATFALGTIIPILLLFMVLQQQAFQLYQRVRISSNLPGFLSIFPRERLPFQLLCVVVLVVALSLVGLYFVRNIIQRILKLTAEARTIVQNSNFAQQIKVMSEDEIGELRDTMNFVIARLQQNMQELEQYEKRLIVSEKEKNQLLEKTRTLSVRDEVTGLYNAQYFRNRWKEEIRRAMLFQRPCSLFVLEIVPIKKFEETQGVAKTNYLLKEVSRVIRQSLKGVEKVAHTQPGEFMVILPEKNKKESLVEGELLLKKVQGFISHEQLELVVNGGVVSSPLDGVESADLVGKVKEAVSRARKESPGQVLGF